MGNRITFPLLWHETEQDNKKNEEEKEEEEEAEAEVCGVKSPAILVTDRRTPTPYFIHRRLSFSAEQLVLCR